MKPKLLVVAAGIPPEVGDKFVTRFNKTFSIVSLLPLDRSEGYTNSYSEDLYRQFSMELKRRGQIDRSRLLSDVNLVLLYLDKKDGSEAALLRKFGVEALVVPLKWPKLAEMTLATGNQRGQAVNGLIREGRRAIGHARNLLAVIAEEITNRDNKTCLLLPCRNFGRQINEIFNCVRDAVLSGGGQDEFKKNLDRVSRSLRTSHADRRRYFVGEANLVFRSPGKAGARHGLAPVWGNSGHDSSCVIRGRLRFGASFDPKFHYDCHIPRGGNRRFPSCHGEKEMPRGRTHVNIAPNDNIR